MKRLTVMGAVLLAFAGCGGDGEAERAERPSVLVTIDGVATAEGDSAVIDGTVVPSTATIEADGEPADVEPDGTFTVAVEAPRGGMPGVVVIEGRARGHWPYRSTVSIPGSPGGQAAGATPEPRPRPKPKPRPTGPVTLKVNVYDDTTSNSADELEIWARGSGSFYPDLIYGGDTREVLIEDGKLLLYPDGRDGAERSIKLRPPPDLIEGSERDAITVDIADAEITVHGTSIPGDERRFPR